MQMLESGISLVICTFNGKNRLAATLSSIFSLKDPADWPWELIIIDNASTDGTKEFCEEQILQAGFQHQSKVLTEPKQGCNHARLNGLYASKYKWMLFCDDDNHLEEDYLINGYRLIQQYVDLGVLGGCALPLFESVPPIWFEQYKHSFAVGPQFSRDGRIPRESGSQLYSAGSFFNREVLLKYYDNGFQTIMVGPHGNELTRGEDTEWCMMIQLAGYELYYSASLKFQHFMPDNRMSWDYYLRLKKGIASGIARLASYVPFFKKKNPGNIDFLRYYIKEALIFRLLRWRISFKKSATDSDQLAKMIIEAKADAYVRDFNISRAHFFQLQRILKKI